MAQRSKLETKMGQAYTTLICTHPFFATLLLRLEKVEGHTVSNMFIAGPCPCPADKKWPECPHSMATDGKRLIYNPRFVENLSLDQLVAVLAHEVMHVAGLHPWRRGTRKPGGWNYACDQVVNNIVQEAKMTLPANCVPPVPDKSAEELYLDLPEQQQQNGSGGSHWGEVIDPTNSDGSSLSDAQREQQMGEAKIMVQQAANAAKRAGKLPAGLARLVDETLEPKVPWKEILARFIDGNARNDYSWSRPNRRYLELGLVLPSLWSPGYGEVIMGCDTSGSIDQEQLKEIAAELMGCLAAYQQLGQPVELTMAWFDHAVYPQVISEPEDLDPKGGGGTSFSVVFEWVRKEGLTPKAIIMVTDGYCSDFGEQPECPVLWILTQKNREFKPEFGELCCVLND